MYYSERRNRNSPFSKSRKARNTTYSYLENASEISSVSAGLCPKPKRRTVEELYSCEGHTCVVCANTKAKDPNVTFHWIPKDTERRAWWLEVFGNIKYLQYIYSAMQ